MDDKRFWEGLEKIEAEFLSTRDEPAFRRKMRRRGLPFDVINERVAAVNADWEAIYMRPNP